MQNSYSTNQSGSNYDQGERDASPREEKKSDFPRVEKYHTCRGVENSPWLIIFIAVIAAIAIIAVSILLLCFCLTGGKTNASLSLASILPLNFSKTEILPQLEPTVVKTPPATKETVKIQETIKKKIIYEERVFYTEAGFSPSVLRVGINTTVVFRNQSKGKMWIASNPHPTHTDYPDFDARGCYEIGSDYAFTFTKKGVWGYHDHLRPSSTGVIIVE